jgi:hypothetical protein
MFVCCVLSGRGLCDELITCPEESNRLWCIVCDLETSRMRRSVAPKSNKQTWCRSVLKFKVRSSDVKFCKYLGAHGGTSSYNDFLGVYTVLYKNVGTNPFIPSSLSVALFHQNSLHHHTKMTYFSVQVL